MTANARRLLVIADDYDHIADLLAELVELEFGYETVAVKDGAAAVRETLARRPDTVLLDIDMPILGGIDAAREISEALGEARPTLLASTGGVNADKARASGFFDTVMGKPITIEGLFQAIAKGKTKR